MLFFISLNIFSCTLRTDILLKIDSVSFSALVPRRADKVIVNAHTKCSFFGMKNEPMAYFCRFVNSSSRRWTNQPTQLCVSKINSFSFSSLCLHFIAQFVHLFIYTERPYSNRSTFVDSRTMPIDFFLNSYSSVLLIMSVLRIVWYVCRRDRNFKIVPLLMAFIFVWCEHNVVGCWSMFIFIGHCLWASSMESSFQILSLVGIDENTIGSEKAISMNSMHIGRIETIENTSKAESPDRWLVVDHKYWIIVNDGKRIHIICVSMYYYWPVVSFICFSPPHSIPAAITVTTWTPHSERTQLNKCVGIFDWLNWTLKFGG